MSSQVLDTFTIIRVADISGGLATDPDWGATNDISGWRSGSDPHWWKPTHHRGALAGSVNFMLLFYDSISVVVPALLNTRVDLELVELVQVEKNLVAPRLVSRGLERQVPGDAFLEDAEPMAFSGEMGTRLVASQNLPVANFLAVLARIA